MKLRLLALLIVCPLAVTGCPRDNTDDLTLAEASQALDESTIDSEGQELVSDNIELATSFTIGQAVQAAAQEMSNFIATELPCASVSVANNTVTVSYSAISSDCLYHGHVITGTSEITVTKDDTGDVEVDHRWTALSNGLVQVDGTATVTWSSTNASRTVEHDVTIERLSDHKTVESSGDRSQTALNGDITVGISVNGTRSLETANGTFDLTIDNVQMRWVDPVPQAGSYALLTPKDKSITLSFARVDSDTIAVTLASGKKSFTFDVDSTGEATAEQ